MTDLVIAGGAGTAAVAWDPNSGAALPAYLAGALEDLGSNIADRMNVPSLSYEGKTWSIVKDGNKTKLQMVNSEGDTVPVPVMRAVVLEFNGDRGRAYYEGVYNPAAAAAPKCWSADGKAPDDSVKEKQSTVCQTCPMSAKGSKVQDGKEMVACSSHRMMAIAPAFDLAADPLRLKIAITSDWDKDTVEHGWYAFRQYVDFLKSRGISHTALVVTKMKFDANTAYPKILFAVDRVLTPDEVVTVQQAVKNPKVKELLAERWTAAGTKGTPTDDSDIRPHGLEGAYLDGWQAHPTAPGYSYKGQEVLLNEEVAAKYPAPPPPATKPASEQVVEHVPAAPAPVVSANDPVSSAPVWNPIEHAEADGWVKHPTSPDYHYKGNDVVLSKELMERYPAPAVAPAAPPAAPAAPVAPAAPPAPVVDPIIAAESDGWIKHPTSPEYHYKGTDVVLTTEVAARYAGGNGASAATAGAGDQGSAGAAASTSTTATTAASPSSGGEMPAEVKGLLDKWTGG